MFALRWNLLAISRSIDMWGTLERGYRVLGKYQLTMCKMLDQEQVFTYVEFRTSDGIIAYEEHKALSWGSVYASASHLYDVTFG